MEVGPDDYGNIYGSASEYYLMVVPDTDQFMMDLNGNSAVNNDPGFNLGIPLGAASFEISAGTELLNNEVRTHFKTGRNPFSWAELKPNQQAWRMKHVLGKYCVKYLGYLKWAGVAGNVLTVGIAGYDIFKGEDTMIDWCDAGVGVTAIGGAIFIGATPVGWAIGVGSGIYFAGRLVYDIYEEGKKK